MELHICRPCWSTGTLKTDHSQRVQENPLLSWVIADASGTVFAGQCNCMEDLGESCSHVSSFLWAVEACVNMTVTQGLAYWASLPSVKEVPYASLSYIHIQGKGTHSLHLKVLSQHLQLQPIFTHWPYTQRTSSLFPLQKWTINKLCGQLAQPSLQFFLS